MKLLKILKKNFKLLLRSKMTALVVIVAPLLIILFAGVAFRSDSSSNFNIGVYQKANSTLAQSFIVQLENNSFTILSYNSEELCKSAIKQSLIQACIIFPENFTLEEGKATELRVLADYSRKNFVFYIVESVSRSIQTRTSALSLDLTNNILNALANAKQKNEEVNLQIVQLKSDLETVQASTDTLATKLNSLDVESETISLTEVGPGLTGLKQDIAYMKTQGVDAISKGVAAANLALAANSSFDNTTITALNAAKALNDSEIINQYNSSITAIDDLIASVDKATATVTKLTAKLDGVKTFKTAATTDLATMKAKLEAIKTNAEQIKATLESVNQNIDSLSIKSAEKIVQPIKTVVEPVVTETTNINYMFSYLVVLIVMFVSILLSSTTIIMEKKSQAYFRNFTTPTSDFMFVISTYLTTIIIMFLQLVVLFVMAKFFLKIPILNNIWLTILLLFIAVSLFTAIGMGIGYWFSSQEAAIILSMSVGSIFLLLSNLILPLEVMPKTIRMIAGYNPYVMLSELLRQIVIFNIRPQDAYYLLSLMAIVALGIFMLILFIQKVQKFAYFKHVPETKKQKVERKKEGHNKSLKLYEKSIENDIDLLNELKNMDDSTFETYVNKDKNDFYNWAKYVLKDKKLAAKLKVKTRTEMISNIEKK